MAEREKDFFQELRPVGIIGLELGIPRERVIELIKEKGIPFERRGKHRSYYASLFDVRMHVNPNWRRRGWMTNLHGQ